jgi:hypothetical protein
MNDFQGWDDGDLRFNLACGWAFEELRVDSDTLIEMNINIVE